MARLQKDVVDYFPHDAKASTGDTLTVLQDRFGNNGYAFWFKLLEKLASADGHYLDCRNSTKWLLLLAKARVDEPTGAEIMEALANMQAIDKELWESRIIWSQNLVDNVSSVYKNRRRVVPEKPVSSPEKPLPIVDNDAEATLIKSQKTWCRSATRLAVSKGLLTKEPCKVCGNPYVEPHHEDYADPFKVTWLCPEHHRQLLGNNYKVSTSSNTPKPPKTRVSTSSNTPKPPKTRVSTSSNTPKPPKTRVSTGQSTQSKVKERKVKKKGKVDKDIILSNLVKVYEDNIGMVTPLIRDELVDSVTEYPEGWFEEAVKIACANNARRLNYILRVLENWKRDGFKAHKQAPESDRKEGPRHVTYKAGN